MRGDVCLVPGNKWGDAIYAHLSGKHKDYSVHITEKWPPTSFYIYIYFFFSIHQNKFTKERCYGAQVWYADNEKSTKLGELIQVGLKEKVQDGNTRLAKNAKNQYRILRDGYDGACVIVECGFISNPAEEERLKTEEHQNQIIQFLLRK